MSTVRKETDDTRNEKEQLRERGGQVGEDRAKDLEGGESTSPFDDPENDPKRKE